MPLLIGQCPSCGGTLQVRKLWCPECEIAMAGNCALGALACLSPEQQQFIVEFVQASGSLKAMAKRFKVSYPTVRNRLDELIRRIQQLEQGDEHDE